MILRMIDNDDNNEGDEVFPWNYINDKWWFIRRDYDVDDNSYVYDEFNDDYDDSEEPVCQEE